MSSITIRTLGGLGPKFWLAVLPPGLFPFRSVLRKFFRRIVYREPEEVFVARALSAPEGPA